MKTDELKMLEEKFYRENSTLLMLNSSTDKTVLLRLKIVNEKQRNSLKKSKIREN